MKTNLVYQYLLLYSTQDTESVYATKSVEKDSGET